MRVGTDRPFRLCSLTVPEAIEIINEVLVTTLCPVYLVEVLQVSDDISTPALADESSERRSLDRAVTGFPFRISVECFSAAPDYCCA